jgi:enoyl-CoA hydratase/carnithine racemase
MDKWQNIQAEIEDKVAVLTIDHPPVNSFNAQVVTELERAIEELMADDEVKVIVITGGGAKAFVAGADIPEIKEQFESPDAAGAVEFVERGQRVFLKIERSPKPVIAAINGFCLGGGMELAMACHLRICSEKARLGQPEINLGIIPGWGGTQRLPRLTNKGIAIELILTGDMISAQEAHRLGLVNQVVPDGEALEAALDLARKIAVKSRFPTAAALRAISEGLELSIEQGLELEAEQFVLLREKQDPLEGIEAFLEKRPPQFQDQ